ncbi:AraC family transcriptional regulator [Evansella sp. AB-P1]|uniref:AraC family transcriptional regulator n=1 Tax=Evansella sp. AB-P1 TaxID=3037653 RepID=UPI00242020EE|nr:AraC family transcriptional regulator [Evansella sp. AB-P1]MDG5786633.1 AraC family transcriptional regulator [Evansella sp. AB-P1]
MIQLLDVSQRDSSFYIHYNNHDASKVDMEHYHLHDDYEIYYLLEGSRIYYINGKKYKIHENNLVFINKNVIHKTGTADFPTHKRIVMNFKPSIIQKHDHSLLSLLFENGPTIISVPPYRQKKIIELMTSLYKEYGVNDSDGNTYIRSLLLLLLIESKRLVEQQQEVEKEASISVEDALPYDNVVISNIIKYINNNYMNDVSLPHLSNKFHLSEAYISRLFKKVTGCNTINYINTVRIKEGKRLLLETDLKIAVIAKKVGFKNNVHFYRVFKSVNDVSPTNFRKQNTNNLSPH